MEKLSGLETRSKAQSSYFCKEFIWQKLQINFSKQYFSILLKSHKKVFYYLYLLTCCHLGQYKIYTSSNQDRIPLKKAQNGRSSVSYFWFFALQHPYFFFPHHSFHFFFLIQIFQRLCQFILLNYIVNQGYMMTQPDPHENLLVIEDRNFDESSCKKYKKGNFLGKGGFARCYELIDEQAKTVQAVKIIQKSSLTKPRSKQKLMSEIKIHQSLHHRNIVQFRRNFQDHVNVYIVLEICTNKTLNDLLKKKRKLTQSQIKYYILQVLNGLEYLHNRNIVHRDLKLGNLFLSDSMEIKLGDFGLATKLQYPGDKRKTICGTPNYIAPEILQSKGHSCEVDIWSLGVICYTLAFGRPPFESKDVKQTYKKIKSGIFSFPTEITVSSQFKQVIISCLEKEPHQRPTSSELKGFDFFVGVSLSRQPSISFRTQTSISITKQEKDLSRSDNGKIYTNNDLMTSKDTARQKSQDKFLVTDRSINSIHKNISYSNLRRANSQRILKDSNLNSTNKNLLTKSPSKQYLAESNNFQQPNLFVSVKKWIDYSSKYGIGYALTNGACGVYFNDSSKMLAYNEDQFYYIQKIDRQDNCKKFTFLEYPAQLKKKVSLFGHFKGYLSNQSENYNGKSTMSQEKDLIYIRRWYRAKHAVIFRLSNKSVQVLFIDQSQILISSSKKKVMYTSKTKQRSQYWLNEVMQSDNRELIKRFQYTKEVLNQMAGQQNKNKN